MCGALLGGFWWVLPLIGLAVCLGFMVMASRFARAGRGGMCMGGHSGMTDDAVAQTRGEIDARPSR